ncbi:hypothetical protein B9Z55_015972 [Caenorhabditis nigoni]|uniref:Rad4 beta-hairpin domain-containing protein n=1 Tax=Caenorhabditis nigoni TaxID=1611254 RepID=A0A2G5UCW1_9PELO|nr:hypothetical protein B9Z55_015972 [Caenorhabditis nigoni]
METRRRSARLQLQTQNSQNVDSPPIVALEEPKKPRGKQPKKNEEKPPMAAKTAPKKRPRAPPKRRDLASPTPEDLGDVVENIQKTSTPPKKHALSESSSSEDEEHVSTSKVAPKAAKTLQKTSKSPEVVPEDSDARKIAKTEESDDNMETDAPEAAPESSKAPTAAPKSTSSRPSKYAQNSAKNSQKKSKSPEDVPEDSDAEEAAKDEESDGEMEIDTPEAAPTAPKRAQNALEASKSTSSRPRRSIATFKRVSYAPKDHLAGIDEMSSSSSDEASDSDDVMDSEEPKKNPNPQKRGGSRIQQKEVPKKRSKAFKIESEESSSDSYESGESEESENDDSEATGPSSRSAPAKKGRFGASKGKSSKSKGSDQKDAHWPKCSKASIARKTGNPKNSKNVKSGLRMAVKQKPPQPWKKNLANYEADRKLAKGERRMLEYRVVAHAYARGKVEEVSYDECFKIHENMKKAYFEGRKIIDALEPEKLGGGGDKKHRKHESQQKRESSDDQESSEDEWEEMEHFHPVLDDNIEVSIDHEANGDEEEGVEKDWWVVYLRQEVNRKIREAWENTHKVHLLCYMAHLKQVVKTALDESLVPSLMMSQLPNGYLKYTGEIIPIDVMTNLVKWYTDAFRPLNGVISVAAIEQDLSDGHEARFPETTRLTALVNGKCYETDLDRATLLFCLLRGLEATCRIVVNARTIPRRWDKNQQKELQKEMDKFKELSRSRSQTPKEEEDKEPSTSSDSKKAKKATKRKEERNYWVEYWQPFEKRWICIDPLHKTVDEPLTIHEDATSPISYVFGIDHRYGICELSQRYAMDCVKQEFRRRRCDPKWLAWTLSLRPFAANAERAKWEAMQLREELVKRPLPTTMSEFKNHPLYVLEKDLLKFEAIYPPPKSQKPLGQIRGHNVYPRSCVFTLQGENNWLKLARSVKIGEEPYKVVKARPNPKIPVEDREDQFLNVYGYWQTEEYRRPALKNGKIPHNDYGNVYMFQPNMCPLECVHLKLPGLVQLSRKLNKQCVPAVVGWAFDGGFTHPVIDGAIVLEKDAPLFRREWEKLEEGKAEREENARVERIHENWKKLIKGMLRLNYVRKQFGHNHPQNPEKKKKAQKTSEKKKKAVEDVEMDSDDGGAGPSEPPPRHEIIDNSEKMGPLAGFSLDDFINKKK